ncbi:MAG: hypothetical protein JXA21_03765, partial [Anaerolineae bacterium]|nr:hypothetical protein [Anaerolineae bacterium]
FFKQFTEVGAAITFFKLFKNVPEAVAVFRRFKNVDEAMTFFKQFVDLDNALVFFKQFPNADEALALAKTLGPAAIQKLGPDAITKLGPDALKKLGELGDPAKITALLDNFLTKTGLDPTHLKAALTNFADIKELERAMDSLHAVFGTGSASVIQFLKNETEVANILANYDELVKSGIMKGIIDKTDARWLLFDKKTSDVRKMLGPVLANFGEGVVDVTAKLPDEFASAKKVVLGTFDETVKEGAAGVKVLVTPGDAWSMEVNFAFISDVITQRKVVELATPLTSSVLVRDAKNYYVSVYTRELNMLLNAGYRRVGKYLVPPSLP